LQRALTRSCAAGAHTLHVTWHTPHAQRVAAAHAWPVTLPLLLLPLQYLGDAEALQELEDFGQLDSALQGHALPQPGRD
jgi:hypothetical protein